MRACGKLGGVGWVRRVGARGGGRRAHEGGLFPACRACSEARRPGRMAGRRPSSPWGRGAVVQRGVASIEMQSINQSNAATGACAPGESSASPAGRVVVCARQALWQGGPGRQAVRAAPGRRDKHWSGSEGGSTPTTPPTPPHPTPHLPGTPHLMPLSEGRRSIHLSSPALPMPVHLPSHPLPEAAPAG